MKERMVMSVMGAAVIVIGFLLFALLLLFLVELYCSLILKSRLRIPNSNTASSRHRQQEAQQPQLSPSTPPTLLPNKVYSQGVLMGGAPTTNLFFNMEQQQKQQNHHLIGLLSKSMPSLSPIAASPSLPQEDEEEVKKQEVKELGGEFICMSNPIYDDYSTTAINTPFETPETSPSRLESVGSSSSSESQCYSSASPPLTPMKKLPSTVVCGSVAGIPYLVMDKTLVPSISTDSNGSTSSGSRCASPSW